METLLMSNSTFKMLKNALIENCNKDENLIKKCYKHASDIEDKYRKEGKMDLVNPSEFMRNAYNESLKFKNCS